MLIADLENAIARANTPGLSENEYNETKSLLLKFQSTATPPNTFIPMAAAALSAIEHHMPKKLQWWQTPLGAIFIAGMGGFVTWLIILPFKGACQ